MEKGKKTIDLIHEYSDEGSMIYLHDYFGAFVRGKTKEEAIKKIPTELERYLRWTGGSFNPYDTFDYRIIESIKSDGKIEDGDTVVIFPTERIPLKEKEYFALKSLVLKSALDFILLYSSVPDTEAKLKEERATFYGPLPTAANDMLEHLKKVNGYYFGEIGISLKYNKDLLQGREEGFNQLEGNPNFLENTVFKGGDGEIWSLRKTMRRFIWHDTIHAKALYRGACRLFTESKIDNTFCF